MDKVLVLNADYTPLNVTSVRRGFVLVIKGKAEVLRQDAEKIVTTIGEFVRPLIIRLLNYVRFKNKPVKLNRKRVFKRDNNECVYCGGKKNLTIDHIMPRSRGGKNTWANLVTCCSSCNLKKGNRTPEEANMKMLYRVYEPTVFSSVISVDVEELWGDFQKSFV
jgi:CRISPR/Cas system Type II protein with McrA/HNH and RuvC-like nuclease domain